MLTRHLLSEGGAQVPLVVNWPGVVKPGRVCGDLLPTLVAIAGGELATDRGPLDGRSFLPQLRGETGNPRDWIFVQMGQYYYARSRDWRLDELNRLYDMGIFLVSEYTGLEDSPGQEPQP